jgi:hypothetical protein
VKDRLPELKARLRVEDPQVTSDLLRWAIREIVWLRQVVKHHRDMERR